MRVVIFISRVFFLLHNARLPTLAATKNHRIGQWVNPGRGSLACASRAFQAAVSLGRVMVKAGEGGGGRRSG